MRGTMRAGVGLGLALGAAGCVSDGVAVTGEYRQGYTRGAIEWLGAGGDVPVEVRGGVAGLDRATLERGVERGLVGAGPGTARFTTRADGAAADRAYRIVVAFGGGAAAGEGACRAGGAEVQALVASVALCERDQAIAAAAGSSGAPASEQAVAGLVSGLSQVMLRLPPPRP